MKAYMLNMHTNAGFVRACATKVQRILLISNKLIASGYPGSCLNSPYCYTKYTEINIGGYSNLKNLRCLSYEIKWMYLRTLTDFDGPGDIAINYIENNINTSVPSSL
uniref:Uncharacterized protein n=1 Tax=Glossina austeni TaxID=7395 RepID=A0A1A9VNQ8_GLOAU